MEQVNPMNPFELTATIIAEIREKEVAARARLDASRAALTAEEFAYTKCFTPILTGLLATRGSLTRPQVHRSLLDAGFTPGPALADDIIKTGVAIDLIVVAKQSEPGQEIIYESSPRYSNLMGKIYFSMI